MLVTFSLPDFNLKKQMCSSWAFHEDDILSHQRYMIWLLATNRDLLGKFQNNERWRYNSLSSVEALIEVYMNANEA
jgi:hypothetical protein